MRVHIICKSQQNIHDQDYMYILVVNSSELSLGIRKIKFTHRLHKTNVIQIFFFNSKSPLSYIQLAPAGQATKFSPLAGSTQGNNYVFVATNDPLISVAR